MASCYYEVIWKGQDGVLSIPFDVSGYSEVSLTVLTSGDVMIEYEQERLTIEDGYITISYDNTDLDVLPDGVIRYIIDYKIGNVDGVLSSNLNVVLKTPEGYSAETADVLVQNAYDSGYADGYPVGYDSGYTDGHSSGYTEGYGNGRSDGYDEGYTDGDQAGYNEGYDNGVQDGKTSGYTTGYTDGFNAGYDSGSTDGFGNGYQSGSTDGYNSGYTSGYINGWNSGLTEGYNDGYEEGYDSGRTDGYDSGHTAGYNEGIEDGFNSGHTSGYTDGVSHQKSLLSAITITINGNYTRENGYSAITVNVPQTGATPQQLEEAYNSGYTNGYEAGESNGFDNGHISGYTDGVGYQKSLLVSTAITENGTYSRENGYSSISVNIPQTGATPQQVEVAYNSGITEGQRQQKSLLSAITITENGTYTRENGFSSVTVSIAQTGYTQQDLDNAFNSGYTSGWNSGYQSGYTDGYNHSSGAPDAYLYMPFTIEIVSGSTFTIKYGGNCEYSINGGEWIEIPTTGPSSFVLNVSTGDIIQIKGDEYVEAGQVISFGNTADTAAYKVYGNAMSLLYKENYYNRTAMANPSDFSYMFNQCYGLLDAENLKLPATTLKNYCYNGMFYHCDNLRKAPELPATTLAQSCYLNMFAYCRSLTTAPALPATTLETQCYQHMFQGCEALMTAPELPAPILVTSCYKEMFNGCSILNYVKCLATDISTYDTSLNGWLVGVPGTGTFVKKVGVEYQTGYYGIPSGWTVQEV